MRPRIKISRLKDLSLLLVLLTASLQVTAALSEARLKAVYLYQFMKFTKLPELPSADYPLQICQWQRDTLGDAVGIIKDKTVAGRQLSFKIVVEFNEIQQCQLLYIVQTNDEIGSVLVVQSIKQPILIVTETDREGQRGMINFVRKGLKLKFQVDNTQAEQVGLEFSSKLLKIAVDVR